LPECIVATYEMAAQAALHSAREACDGTPSRENPISPAVAAVLKFAFDEPELAHVLTDPALVDVPGLLGVREDFTAALGECLTSVRRSIPAAPQVDNRRLDRHLVQAARAWIARHLEAGPDEPSDVSATELAALLSGGKLC
jgi:hypothetical protein